MVVFFFLWWLQTSCGCLGGWVEWHISEDASSPFRATWRSQKGIILESDRQIRSDEKGFKSIKNLEFGTALLQRAG